MRKSRFKRQTIKRGNHYTIWYQRYWGVYANKDHQVEMFIGPKFPYEFRNSDGSINSDLQYDWNKLEGISLNILGNHDRTLMEGYRWDLDGRLAQINFYYHGAQEGDLDYQIISNGAWASRSFIEVGLGKKFIVQRHFEGNDIISQVLRVPDTKQVLKDRVKIEYKPNGRHRRINNYFGGQGKAQQKYSVFKDYQRI